MLGRDRSRQPDHAPLAYLTLPTSCAGPLAFTHDRQLLAEPAPVAASCPPDEAATGRLDGCDTLPFDPVPAPSSTNRATSPTGYDFSLDATRRALPHQPRPPRRQPDPKAVVTLPEGMTINPSVGAASASARRPSTRPRRRPRRPAPAAPTTPRSATSRSRARSSTKRSKASMFFATPCENRFGTLLALYMVAKSTPSAASWSRSPASCRPDPVTGSLTATFDDLPQLPYSHFNVHFREGQRSPLATPPPAAPTRPRIDLTPWLDPAPRPPRLLPPSAHRRGRRRALPHGHAALRPQAAGGSLNRNAAAYTPFYLHLTRTDAEQEITSYSATFPPGLLGKIAGVPFCPEAAIEAARRSPAVEEREHPACPAASLIGHTSPATGSARCSPTRPAPSTSPAPTTARRSRWWRSTRPRSAPSTSARWWSARRSGSTRHRPGLDRLRRLGPDPPHPRRHPAAPARHPRLHRPTRTSCSTRPAATRFAVTSTLTGSGRASARRRRQPATASAPFQVSNCSALGFSPRISAGAEGRHQARPRPSCARRSARAPATPTSAPPRSPCRPRSSSPRTTSTTICTAPQFAAKPARRLDLRPRPRHHAAARRPLEGPVYLRSSTTRCPTWSSPCAARASRSTRRPHRLLPWRPARHSKVPDAPVTKFMLTLPGGKRGLLVNSEDLCAGKTQRPRS